MSYCHIIENNLIPIFLCNFDFFCLILPKKLKKQWKNKKIHKNIDRLYKIVYYIVKNALCIVWTVQKTVSVWYLWKCYVISCKFPRVLYDFRCDPYLNGKADVQRKEGENIVSVVKLRCYLKKKKGGKSVRNVTGIITVLKYGRENV